MTVLSGLEQLADVLNDLAKLRDNIMEKNCNIDDVPDCLHLQITKGDTALSEITTKLGVELENQL